MKYLTPTILILAAVALFFGYIKPTYSGVRKVPDFKNIQELRSEKARFEAGLQSAERINQKISELKKKMTAVSEGDKQRMSVMIPVELDKIRLLVDVNKVANKYGMSITGIGLSGEDALEVAEPRAPGRPQVSFGVSENIELTGNQLSFTVSGPYSTFISFLRNLEESLRIIDIESIRFTPTDDGLYTYSVVISTYSLEK